MMRTGKNDNQYIVDDHVVLSLQMHHIHLLCMYDSLIPKMIIYLSHAIISPSFDPLYLGLRSMPLVILRLVMSFYTLTSH